MGRRATEDGMCPKRRDGTSTRGRGGGGGKRRGLLRDQRPRRTAEARGVNRLQFETVVKGRPTTAAHRCGDGGCMLLRVVVGVGSGDVLLARRGIRAGAFRRQDGVGEVEHNGRPTGSHVWVFLVLCV